MTRYALGVELGPTLSVAAVARGADVEPWVPEISAGLRTIVEEVAEREGAAPDVVVLVTPEPATDEAQGRLLEAARLAGLEPSVVRLLPESAAIALGSGATEEPTFAAAVGAALAGAEGLPAAEDEPTAGVVGLAAGAAAAGLAGGGAAALGAGALLDGGAAAAAAGVNLAAPVGVPLAAAGPVGVPVAAGPAGVPVAAGPVGVPVAAGPLGVPIEPEPPPPPPTATPPPSSRPPRRVPKRVAIGAGVAVGAAVIAGAIAVASPSGDDDPSPAPTTTEAAAAVTTTEATAASPTSSRTAGRGLPGLVTAVAGNGEEGTGERTGPAESTSLGSAARFAVAPNGDLFVVNHDNELLLVSGGQTRVLYRADTGAGESGFGGVAVGPNGDAFLTLGTGVKRVARDGTSSLVVDAKAQNLHGGFGPIAVDQTGSITFFDNGSYRVLSAPAGGAVTVVAGTGTQARIGSPPEGDGGPATAAPLAGAGAIVLADDGAVLVAETGRAVVRRVAPDGTITTVAGGGSTPLASSGEFAPDGTKATDVKFTNISGLAVDDAGRLYVADDQAHAIVRFGPDGMELVAADQEGTTAELNTPANAFKVLGVSGLGLDGPGNLLFVQDNRVLRIAGAATQG